MLQDGVKITTLETSKEGEKKVDGGSSLEVVSEHSKLQKMSKNDWCA